MSLPRNAKPPSRLCSPDGNTSISGSRRNGTSRPVSFYDNCVENGNGSAMVNNSNNRTIMRDKNTSSQNETTQLDGTSPSMAHCLMTTVPQNIVAQNIAKKHAPTRNSLRHSRMIAMNKNGSVPRKYLPAIIRYHKLAKALMGFVMLLGAALCVLALWLIIWAPNIRQRDNPHWSGIPVLLSGIVGMALLCCFRKEYPGMKRNYFVYSVKVLSISLSTLGAVTSFTACAFAVLHLVALYTMNCSPPDNLESTCVCRRGSNSTNNVVFQDYHYVDLSCLEVDNILTILIIFSSATNLLTGILEVWYVYLHWASRYIYTYSKVRTDENTPTIFSNNSR